MARMQWLVLAALLISGCTTTLVQNNQLALSSMNHCFAPEGVSLRYNSLTIALGDRPNAGYGIEVIGQTQKNGEYQLLFRETLPDVTRRYKEETMQPCVQIRMPNDWRRVTVTQQHPFKQWHLTPSDDSALTPVATP